MSGVWQETAPDERLGEARPGALLTSAGAVPLGAAVLIAAGLLPWGGRFVLGAALVVLGLRVRALDDTPLGSRIRPATARALGVALLVGGIVLAVAAVGVALDGGRIDAAGGFDPANGASGLPLSIAGGGPYGVIAALGTTLDGWPGLGFGVLLALAGALLVREGRTPTAGVVLGGLGVGVGLASLTGEGALELGADLRAAVVVVLAASGVVAAVRGPVGAGWGRAAGVAAGTLLALLVGEGTGLVGLLVSGSVGGPFQAPTREGAIALVLLAASAISVVLLTVAVRRRDVVLGVLPAGILLLPHPVATGVGQVGVLVVPVLGVAVAAAAVSGLPAARRLVPGPVALAVLAAATLVLLVAVSGAFVPSAGILRSAGNGFGDVGVSGGRLAVAIAATVGLLLIAGLAVASDGRAGVAAALTVLVGLHVLHPLGIFRDAAPDSFVAGDGAVVVLALVELAIGLVVARRHATPLVVAAAGLLVASTLRAIGIGIAFSGHDGHDELLTVATLGPATVAVVLAAVYALVGPARHVLRAQAASVGVAFGTLLYGSFAATVLAFASDDGGGAVLEGGPAVIGLALVGVFALGTALLAASTARRPSAPVAVAALGATATLALVAAAVGAAVAGAGVNDVRTLGAPVVQAALGFEDAGSLLQRVGAGWPVLLAVLGAVLVGAGAWLESRRPLPPDAPLG